MAAVVALQAVLRARGVRREKSLQTVAAIALQACARAALARIWCWTMRAENEAATCKHFAADMATSEQAQHATGRPQSKPYPIAGALTRINLTLSSTFP